MICVIARSIKGYIGTRNIVLRVFLLSCNVSYRAKKLSRHEQRNPCHEYGGRQFKMKKPYVKRLAGTQKHFDIKKKQA